MTEKELRKKIRKEVRETLAEENIITRVLGKVFDGMSRAAQKRALKKMLKTPELVDLMKSADNPVTNSYIDKIRNDINLYDFPIDPKKIDKIFSNMLENLS